MLLLCKAVIFCDSLDVFFTLLHRQTPLPSVAAQLPPPLSMLDKGTSPLSYAETVETNTLYSIAN